MEFRYEIGDKVYIQRPLVLGQIRQLLENLKGIMLPQDGNILSIVNAFGDRLPVALAVVLTPEGISPKDKDIKSLAEEIEFTIEPEQAIKVVEDFFDCNPIPALIERASGMLVNIPQKMSLKSSSASSPEEILLNATPSSGDTPSENASLISSSDREK